jgi:hypothetical protein
MTICSSPRVKASGNQPGGAVVKTFMGRRVLHMALLCVSGIVAIAIGAVAPTVVTGARMATAAMSVFADRQPHSCGGG